MSILLGPVTQAWHSLAKLMRRWMTVAGLLTITLVNCSPGLRLSGQKAVAQESHVASEDVDGDETKTLEAEIERPILSRRNLLIREIEGVELKADMFRPADDSVCPLVVMIHGGAWAAGDKWELIDHARELAQAGFVAVSINYRLAPKFKIQAQVEDCEYAVRWAIEQAEEWSASTERIGLWGYSAGAHLASLIALRQTARTAGIETQQALEPQLEYSLADRSSVPTDLDEAPNPSDNSPRLQIAAVVAGGAPCEFSFIGKRSPLLIPVMGGTRAQMPEVYREMSPLEYAHAEAPPFFLFHGTADRLVPPSSSRALYEALLDLGVEVEYYSVRRRGHWLTFINNKARRQAVEFLKKHLAAQP